MAGTYQGEEFPPAPNVKDGKPIPKNSFYPAIAPLESPKYYYDYDGTADSTQLVQYLRNNGF